MVKKAKLEPNPLDSRKQSKVKRWFKLSRSQENHARHAISYFEFAEPKKLACKLEKWTNTKLGKHPAPHKFVDRKLPPVINALKSRNSGRQSRSSAVNLCLTTQRLELFLVLKKCFWVHTSRPAASARVSLQETIFRLCFRPPPTEAAPALAAQRQWKCLNCGPCPVSRFAKI